MSVQFGRWNLDGRPVDSDYLEKVGATLSPYGPDGKGSYNSTNVSILYYAFHTTKESRSEVQPHSSPSGAVITWDGRLDNRAELIGYLHDSLTVTSPDVAIVAAAYEKWGTNSFAKFIGDWALSIWNPKNCSLLLAKDPIGTRHLYYSFDDKRVTWSTMLDPLVRFADKTFVLDEEYIAGWFSMFPAVHLTPCVGVHSVPPSSFVFLPPGKREVGKYWDFDPKSQIRYRTDGEYEEHFRTVFTTAVQRKLRSDRPVLAELSGGRDSSSIVCMADEIINRGAAETPRLDTISYYDDSEPNWNERPYFTKVEERRGRVGYHIDAGDPKEPVSEVGIEAPLHRFTPWPCSDDQSSIQFKMCLVSQGNRVVLSGIGGDEVMGGVPSPIPEVADLIARVEFRTLTHRLKAWGLQKRKPWFHLLFQAAKGFLPLAIVGVPKCTRPPVWLRRAFVQHHWAALTGYRSRVKVLGLLPSFQENLRTLDGLRRQLSCKTLPLDPPYDKRYPYLDRDLLEFMFAIPREQLVRPTQRRSLMRRALVGIVPEEILNRKTKAFVSRDPRVRIGRDWDYLVNTTLNMVSSSLGIVDPGAVLEALQKARSGQDVPIVILSRTLCVEDWLKNLCSLVYVKTARNKNPELMWQSSMDS